jgi:hypothetical protein
MNEERVDKHKEKLIGAIANEITLLFEKSLDYAEVAVPNSDQYKKLRSKILRVGNNCIRNVAKEINTKYNVKYIASAETIIESKTAARTKVKA